MRILMITSEWPSSKAPNAVPFIVRQVESLRRAGVEIDVFHFRGAKRLSNYVRAWYQVHRRLAKGSYDAVHAQWGQSALLAFPRSTPLVVTFRGSDLEGVVNRSGRYGLASTILRSVSRFVAQLADAIIIVSESLARYLPNKPYHIIPSGLDLSLFQPIPTSEARARMGLPANKSLVLFVGNTDNPVKRYHLARAAVAKMENRFNVELVVAAEIPQHEMPCYMCACDALLVTSLHEGSPNVVKEALACDLPIVSVDVGDVRLRIGSVEGCVVTSSDSPEAVAAALTQVLRTGRRIMGRKEVLNLDETTVTQHVISVYRKVVAHSKNSADCSFVS